MRYGLGIDTGGTFTDAVLFDFGRDTIVASAKSPTLKDDLAAGVEAAIDGLPAEFLGSIGLVSLSTTLATNACVEGKGGRAKLVLIGCDEEIVARYGAEYGLPPNRDIIFLEGGHDQQGEVGREPDWRKLEEGVEASRRETDAFAVVELWGIRNPDFERRAKELISERTGLSAVCGHELTAEVNSLKRAASALLNAHLIPMIGELLDAVKTVLARKTIGAPLVIVRGDGSLMSEEFARDRPVETLLSGPAASVSGGMRLSGERDCVIVDMGGTTSDIAVVSGGAPRLAAEGARVGAWRTGIQSVCVDTVGLGGDSIIRHNADKGLSIGPTRAAPLSWMASRWPGILGRMRALRDRGRRDEIPLCEYLYLLRDVSDDQYYDEGERKIARALRAGPLGVIELAEATGTSIVTLRTKRLERHGAVMRCALTPTDIMHVSGDFSVWNAEAARIGTEVMGRQIGATVDEIVAMAGDIVKQRLYASVVRVLMEHDDEELLKGGLSGQLDRLLRRSFRQAREAAEGAKPGRELLISAFSSPATVVGIGAPVHVFLPDVAAALGARFVIPEHAGVANAVGAVTGNVMAEETILIRPRSSVSGVVGYLAFSPDGNETFAMLEDAVDWAGVRARDLASRAAAKRGAGKIDVELRVERNEARICGGAVEGERHGDLSKASRILVEVVVTGRATGKIAWS